MGSIVATETSTVTFISVPGYAFARQLHVSAAGHRLPDWRASVVSVLFIPAYFKRRVADGVSAARRAVRRLA